MVLGHPASQVIPLWKYMKVEAVMLNAFQIASSKKLYERAREMGLRELYGIPPDIEIWLDSGGYQALKKGIALKVEDVTKWYNDLKPDYCISLDNPVGPNDPKAREKVRLNVSNARTMSKLVDCELLPVFHPVDEDLFLEYLSGYDFSSYAAVGGLIPRILTVKNASRKEGLKFLERVRKEFPGLLHALGLGSSKMIPLLRTLGYDSADTQTWRHKAAYGKVMLPFRGERHITDRRINFGKKRINEDELREVEKIALILGFTIEDLKRDFVKRAIFNAFVIVSSNHLGTINSVTPVPIELS